MMKPGFVPALATPLDANGNLAEASYRKQIEDMIAAGAVGLLCMGSMGQEAFLTHDVYVKTAQAAVSAAAGRVPVFVGAMDCSIARAAERMADLEDLDVAAFVFTAPFYSVAKRPQMMRYFRGVAAHTKHNIMLYDLPVVTQSKITYDMVLELLQDTPSFIGIKSADLQMFRKLKLNPDVPKDFITVYSGLDTFDVAYKWGVDTCLDGMLPVTPHNTKELFTALANGDAAAAAGYLNNILDLRDFFAAHELWPCYSEAMNYLGYEGDFAPDVNPPIVPEYIPQVRRIMQDKGELPL